MNTYDRSTYRRARREGMGASSALGWARTVAAVPDFVDPGGYTFEREGFTLRVRVRPDDDPDTSWLGRFTDTWEPGAIVTDPYRREPSEAGDRAYRGEWRYFVPAIPALEQREYLRRSHARHVADCLARAYVERDYRLALEQREQVVSVSASREGVKLGGSALGGCDLGDEYAATRAYLHEIVDELADEAILEALEALERLGAAVGAAS